MPPPDFIRVGTLDELKAKGCIVVRGQVHPIAVFFHNGQIRAVDNRCPHMGFPLSQGSVSDGILTCHWHHARFDLASGCTFDLFADDVPVADVEIRNGEVYVASTTRAVNRTAHARQRLLQGMEQDISLIIAKSIITLLREGVDYRDIVREAALFGARHRDGWASGMTIMTAMANLVPLLPEEERYLALFHGLSHVADDCAGEIPRHDRHPLDGSNADPDTLKRWLRNWTRVRHRDAAERTLLTAIQSDVPRLQIIDMLLSAVTDRYYADGGHALDFINKSFELLDLIGWEHAATILPTAVRQLVGARGGEESSAWRHPADLIGLCESTFKQLPELVSQGKSRRFDDEEGLSSRLLSEDPNEVVAALVDAIRSGAKPTQLSKSLAYSAAMRVARFGTSNEFGDWITALHTFTYCNALHQSLKRLTADAAELVSLDPLRGIFHGALSVYLDRFLNIPPAALPGERDRLDAEPTGADELLDRYLDHLNSQQRVTSAARAVARFLSLDHPIDKLFAALARGVLREDADFHTFQMLEAAIRQYHEWPPDSAPARNILVALARYSAAHAPTQRAQHQTADIALKLDRGKPLYEEE